MAAIVELHNRHNEVIEDLPIMDGSTKSRCIEIHNCSNLIIKNPVLINIGFSQYTTTGRVGFDIRKSSNISIVGGSTTGIDNNKAKYVYCARIGYSGQPDQAAQSIRFIDHVIDLKVAPGDYSSTNADCFSIERGCDLIAIMSCILKNSSDGGVDSKSYRTLLHNSIVDGAKRGLRNWGAQSGVTPEGRFYSIENAIQNVASDVYWFDNDGGKFYVREESISSYGNKVGHDKSIGEIIYDYAITSMPDGDWINAEIKAAAELMGGSVPTNPPPTPTPGNYALTAQGSGYFRVYLNDSEYSKHTTEREAAESAINLFKNNPESVVYYKHDYTVNVGY